MKRRMTEREAIILTGILGGVVLILILAVCRPFSWGREMEVTVTGSALDAAESEAAAVTVYGPPVSGAVVGGGQVSGTAIASAGGELVDAAGNTLQTRVKTPEGYRRDKAEKGSLTSFLRDYAMKKDGAKVKLYDGSDKGNQKSHVAVFRLPLEKVDLQQCADSVLRVYAEYFWATEQYDKISFHFANGFLAEYARWREGYHIQVTADGPSYVNSGAYDESYDNFKRFLRMVFGYTSLQSLAKETKAVGLDDIQVGDIFLQGDSKSHVVMVVDVCQSKDGGKAFLLAQGQTPAQQFQLLKNPAHKEDPWYYAEELAYPLRTPEFTFKKDTLRRPALGDAGN